MTISPPNKTLLLFLSQLVIKKGNISRTDTTPCLTRCPKCIQNKGRSKLFRNPQNLWRHLWQTHSYDRNDYPTNELVIHVLDQIAVALHLRISLTSIHDAVKLKMVVS